MKKILALIMLLSITALFASCAAQGASGGSLSGTTAAGEPSMPVSTASDTTASAVPTESPAAASVPNPMKESTPDEIQQKLGLSFKLPEDATDIKYYIIDTGSETQLAQADFALKGTLYTYRIASTAAFTDISGAYFDWTSTENVKVGYCDGEVRCISGQQGICLWYDAAPGLMYSLYTPDGAVPDSLTKMANSLFVPVQGDTN